MYRAQPSAMSSASLSRQKRRRCLQTTEITYFRVISFFFFFRIYENPKLLSTLLNYVQFSFGSTCYYNIACTTGHDSNLSHPFPYGKIFPKISFKKTVVSSFSSGRPFSSRLLQVLHVSSYLKKCSMLGLYTARLALATGAFRASCVYKVLLN